jgi:glucose/arabinose dehydrogenase
VAACGDDADSPPTTAPTTTVPAASPTTISPSSTTEASTTATPSSTTSAPTTTASPTTTSLVPLGELELTLTVVADGFGQPVFVTSPPGDDRLFVVDQPGRIWVIADGDPELFLDIRDRVVFGGEQGLLGLAFPPDYVSSGRFYVDYVGSGPATRISEFTADADGADPASERVLLTIEQPASNHNGGMIAFGPDDLLWIGMGDGGGSNDRFGNGQDPSTLLGTLLRIDPAGDPYTIPAGNPGGGFAPEVVSFGLRNPWRFSFDDSQLWIADVGQNEWEEIDAVSVDTAIGGNFGWPLYEGATCYLADDCASEDLISPVYVYSHSEGCSVTGGYVYRGAAIPELNGHYLFGDYCSGWIRGLAPGGVDEPIEWFPADSVPGLTSFGVDAAGELYVTAAGGTVYRIDRAS